MSYVQLSTRISQYTEEEIISIDMTDPQFLCIQQARKQISIKYHQDIDVMIYKYMSYIIICASISYQLSADGYIRRSELTQYIYDHRYDMDIYDISHRKHFLIQSRSNRRLINMKIKRLEKVLAILDYIPDTNQYICYSQDVSAFHQLISHIYTQKLSAKTVVFTVKIWIYVMRAVYDRYISYPHDISIPIDSRLQRIYELHSDISDDIDIHHFYQKLSTEHNIPPLLLDSLLWIEYRKYISPR